MFDFDFDFSEDYRFNVSLCSIIVWVVCGLIYAISIIPESKPNETFVTSVSETNQPNCVLSAYIMFAKERLDKELLIKKTEEAYPVLANQNVSFGAIKPVWDDMFPSNKLICVFDCSKPDSYNTNKPTFGKPYLWIGMWDINTTNLINHACLVYFHPNGVTFKHFVYNPKTRYNYFVRTNYEFFAKRTEFLYQIK